MTHKLFDVNIFDDKVSFFLTKIPTNTEDSLKDLITAHHSGGTTLANQLFRSLVLVKAAKLAMDQCTSTMTKAGIKVYVDNYAVISMTYLAVFTYQTRCIKLHRISRIAVFDCNSEKYSEKNYRSNP